MYKFIELLDEADRGEAPSPFGKLEFEVPGSPSSIQAKPAVRKAYIASIASKISHLKYLLTGEINLSIIWLLPTSDRFETDAKADIDNCLKPIIDAFTGPDGLFVNDCQIRGLYISWRHITTGDERVRFELDFHPDDYSPKQALAFLHVAKALYVPVNLNWSKAERSAFARALKVTNSLKEALLIMKVDYPLVAGFTGTSFPFHATRVQGFKLMTFEEFTA